MMFKGMVEWYPKWRGHQWRTSSGEVGHRHLWKQILSALGWAGGDMPIRWVPSHLGVEGNAGVDRLAELGLDFHPNTPLPLPKRTQTGPGWEEVGLEQRSPNSDGEARDGGAMSAGDGVHVQCGCQ